MKLIDNIDGVTMPEGITAYEVKPSDEDSENTTRSETGYMNRDRVRASVYTVNVTYRVNMADLFVISGAISPAKFSAKFFNPKAKGYTTAEMYAGPPSFKLVFVEGTAPEDSQWEVAFSLIEF